MSPELTNLWSAFDWDAEWYVRRYSDVAAAVAEGRLADPLQHYIEFGYREGRFSSAAAEEQSCERANHITLGDFTVPLNWPVKGEVCKTFLLRLLNGFYRKYMSGGVVLDVGYKGGHSDAVPILPHAIGVDLDFPGYDGIRLPFEDGSVDTVFASHVLEHVSDVKTVIADWFRVIKIRGFIVCVVPHQLLYERKSDLPSKWSGEHLRFYTPASLLREFEDTLEANTYRIRHLADNDFGYAYAQSPDHHPSGCYEIELVVQKIEPPPWKLS